MNILVLNGPNLNLLGQREPAIYGSQTLAEIEGMLRRSVQRHVRLEFFQSNGEGALIDRLQAAARHCQGVVFNPGGYAHTSVALRDTIAAIGIPVVEVHLSNIHGREEFRSHSMTGAVCAGLVTGFGPLGYYIAIEALERIISRGEQKGEAPRGEQRPPRREEPRRPEEARGPAPEADADESDDTPEARRRRRGRRGGRGRRRDGSEGGGGGEGEGRPAGAPEAPRDRPPVDVAAKYANLKGATVRRGMDVMEEEEGESFRPVGQVSFGDVAAEDVAPDDLTVLRTTSPAHRIDPGDDPDAPIRRVRVTGTRRTTDDDRPLKIEATNPAPAAPPMVDAPASGGEGDEGADDLLGGDEQSTPAKRGRPRKSAAKKAVAKKSAVKRVTKKKGEDE